MKMFKNIRNKKKLNELNYKLLRSSYLKKLKISSR